VTITTPGHIEQEKNMNNKKTTTINQIAELKNLITRTEIDRDRVERILDKENRAKYPTGYSILFKNIQRHYSRDLKKWRKQLKKLETQQKRKDRWFEKNGKPIYKIEDLITEREKTYKALDYYTKPENYNQTIIDELAQKIHKLKWQIIEIEFE